MHGKDYRAALPRPNELKVLNALSAKSTDAQSITYESGVDLTHVYTYLGRMGKLGYVKADGTIRDRGYRITAKGRKAQKLAKQVQTLGGIKK